MRCWWPCLLLAGVLVLGACQALPGATHSQSLYEEIGELPGITALVETFLFRLADDERVNQHFVDTNIVRLRDKLIEHFCELSGGPCVYSGDDMRLTHAGMSIDHADFNALVEDLIDAMDARGIATPTQNRLLALLAPMHVDIIER